MAIIKMVNVRSGKVYGLKAALDYIQGADKTLDGLLVSAKDCLAENALEQMTLTKLHWNRNGGRQYVHLIQSFSLHDNLTYETAHEIGKKMLAQFGGYQGVVATHTNEKHIHNHFILNSVNMETGRKWQMSKADLYRLRERSDEFCREHGLSVIQHGQGWRSYGEYTRASWKERLAQNISSALESCSSRSEFIHNLDEMGITADFGRTNIMFTTADGKKCGNMKLMAYGDFTRQNIENHWKYNDSLIQKAMSNPSVMYEALYALNGLLGTEQDNLMERFYAGRFSALEGLALREWILAQKGSSPHIDHEAEGLKRRQEREAQEKRPKICILGTIGNLLELLQEERQTDMAYEQISELDEEDWEL